MYKPLADCHTCDSVSQFTLLASVKKGKPDFHKALGGSEAQRLYHHFYQNVQAGYLPERVKNGVFQAHMLVASVNDGPVSLFYFHGSRSSSLGLFTECKWRQVTLELSASKEEPQASTQGEQNA